MKWNYRIGRRKKNNKYIYSMIEVYYKSNGSIYGYCNGDGVFQYDDLKSMKMDISYYYEATKRKIIDLDKLDKRYKKAKMKKVSKFIDCKLMEGSVKLYDFIKK
ncbi:MAG: hypothetical protein AABY32_02520 [Nanoarchaeota archaeon]